jgi:cellulose synthase/poly-beta-1,6-N-acetylglucosamine synthase-like glycosyltransferase
MAGADGAMHAVRRHLFTRCPDDTLIEDFVMPMGVVRQGKRVVFEPKAIAWEDGPASLHEEFRRKVRIAAGAAQALIRGNGWPANAPLRFWFIWMSHKLLRWLSPVIGLLVLILALLSWNTLLGKAVLVGWVVLAVAALLRVNAAFYFLFGQAAILVGLIKGVTGTQSVLWAKQNR